MLRPGDPRILPLLPLLALAAGVWAARHPGWSAAALIAAALGASALAPTRTSLLTALVGLLTLAAAGYAATARPPALYPTLGTRGRFYGLVAADPRPSAAGWSVLVDLEAAAPNPPGPWGPAWGRIRLTVTGTPDPPPSRGASCWFRGELRPPLAFRNPGTEGYASYLRRKGVSARAGARWPGEVLFRPGTAAWLAWRREVSQEIGRAAPGPGGSVLRAITLGDRSGLSPRLRDLLRRAGVSHLVAVSGLHLGIVALLIVPAARWALLRWAPRWFVGRPAAPWARATAVPVLVGYAALSGWQVSTMRALAMVILALVSAGLARPRSVPSVLAATALALAVIWPPVLEDPALHLSLAALAGLFWLAPGLEARVLSSRPAWETRLPCPHGLPQALAAAARGMVRISCASAGAALATLPISLFHFGSAPLAGILTNLVSVPLVGWLCLPLGLAGVLAYEPLPGAARLFWAAAGAVLDRWTAAMAAVEPWALSVRLPTLETPLGLAAGLAGLVTLGRWVWRRPGAARWAAGAAGLAMLALALPAIRTALERSLRLWVFDVGQGQALALRLPNGRWVAVDGGGFPHSPFDTGAKIVVPALEAVGCRGLDLVVSTHPHPDHVQGLPTVVRWGRPREVWLPAGFRGDPRYRELLAAGREVEARVRWIGAPTEEPLSNGARIVAWCGPGPGENDRSLLVRVEVWGRAVILPADLEAGGQAAALTSGIPLEAETLVAPHHGAADAWYPPFFRAVRPRRVLVSAGGRRGLPSGRFLRGVEGTGAAVLGTYEWGCLRLDLGPGETRVGPAR